MVLGKVPSCRCCSLYPEHDTRNIVGNHCVGCLQDKHGFEVWLEMKA